MKGNKIVKGSHKNDVSTFRRCGHKSVNGHDAIKAVDLVSTEMPSFFRVWPTGKSQRDFEAKTGCRQIIPEYSDSFCLLRQSEKENGKSGVVRGMGFLLRVLVEGVV